MRINASPSSPSASVSTRAPMATFPLPRFVVGAFMFLAALYPLRSHAGHTDLAPVSDLFINTTPFSIYAANATLSSAIMQGNYLNVSFTVDGTAFSASSLTSIPVTAVWDHSATSTVTVEQADGTKAEASLPDVHYSGLLDDGSASVRATLYDDGIHLVVFNTSTGSLFQVDPVAHIATSFTAEELAAIGGATHVSLVPSTRGAGGPLVFHQDPVTGEYTSTVINTTATAGAVQRRATVDVAIPSVGYAPLWTDCYPNISKNHTARLAFYVTYGTFLQLDGTGATSPIKTLAKLGQLVTDMNIIYEHQLGITIQVHTNNTRVMTAPHTAATANYTWNYGPGYCSTWNNEGGTALRNYLATQPHDSTVTTNFLLTVCSSAGGEVGNAAQPGACTADNIGAVVLSSGLWLTVAHELGHNLNASHAFEEGQGKTGGVMDYSDGRYPIGTGYYGFHPVYNKPEVCPYLTKYQGTACLPLSSTVVASTCGNGIIEGAEDCDPGPGRTSPCCTSACKFVKQCDYMAADSGAAACCSTDCTFKSPSTACGKQSMCRDGACVGVICNSYSNLNACGTGECTFGCSYDGATQTCYPGSQFGWSALTAPTGVHCGSGGTGQCTSAGVCAPAAGSTAKAVCGNGIVEPGEACDPPSACCSATCTFATPATPCGGVQSYCSNGKCVSSSCAQYNNLRICQNGKTENAGCTYGCDFGSGACYNTASISGFTAASGYAADGSFCASGKVCKSGSCVAA
ncbi:hypothetical protein DFJ73DRAFT_784547 [Zopfochytrium polystomum]|nr:hypothetical protein DFJ73DRAFT_784547 [Zopfochytrium polystomum]